MHTSHLSSKGQVVIPKAFRDKYGWSDGLELGVKGVGNGVLLIPIEAEPLLEAKEVAGCLKYKGKKKSLKDMEAAIKKGALKRK